MHVIAATTPEDMRTAIVKWLDEQATTETAEADATKRHHASLCRARADAFGKAADFWRMTTIVNR